MVELTFDFKPQQKPLSWAVPHFGGKDLNKGLTLLNHRNNKMNFNKDKNKVLHFEKRNLNSQIQNKEKMYSLW